MVKFKYNLIALLIILSPNTVGEVQISANDQQNILFVNSGETVFFNSTGVENADSVEWDFGIDLSGPNTRFTNLSNVNHTVHAAGRYNITFTATYGENITIKEMVMIVNYIETFEEDIVYNEALFFAIAGAELIMSAGLGYWTQKIKKEKTYL